MENWASEHGVELLLVQKGYCAHSVRSKIVMDSSLEKPLSLSLPPIDGIALLWLWSHRWGQRLKHGGVGEAEIFIKDKFSEGTADYFNRVARELKVEQIQCVNLLKCALEKAETTLSENFQQAVRELSKSGSFETEVNIVNFDWHTNRKKLNEVDIRTNSDFFGRGAYN